MRLRDWLLLVVAAVGVLGAGALARVADRQADAIDLYLTDERPMRVHYKDKVATIPAAVLFDVAADLGQEPVKR